MKTMKKRKGFTLTELAIVIAVIAILIAVLVPTFTSLINKAHESTDSQLAKNMNTLLTTAETDGDKPERMEDVNKILVDGGYTIAKLTPSADGNIFVWNEETNRISYISEDGTVLYAGDSSLTADSVFTVANNYWVTVESASEIESWSGLSYYFGANISENITFASGSDSSIDTGTYKLTGKLTYTSASSASVDEKQTAKTSVNSVKTGKTSTSTTTGTATLRGTIAELVVDSNINVVNYASITKSATLEKVTTYTESGSTTTLTVNLSSGSVEIKNDGVVSTLDGTSSVTITNNGYIGTVTSTTSTSSIVNNGYVSTVTTGTITNSSSYTYKISNYTDLANFRDKVNNGTTFEGITVELTANINLSGISWVPIGYDSRDNYQTTDSEGKTIANSSYKYFAGTFDGKGYTISGLSNDGFTPTTVRKDTYKSGSGENENYLYGLFGIVSGATIKNVKLTNVDIVFDNDLELDSVGALVGFIENSAYIYNCSASGSIKGTDAVGGLVGRAYDRTSITKKYFDTEGKEVTSTTTADNKTYYNGYRIMIVDCSVNVTITCSGNKAAGILGYTYTKTDFYFENCSAAGSITATANYNELPTDKKNVLCAGIVVATSGGTQNGAGRLIVDCSSSMNIKYTGNIGTKEVTDEKAYVDYNIIIAYNTSDVFTYKETSTSTTETVNASTVNSTTKYSWNDYDYVAPSTED